MIIKQKYFSFELYIIFLLSHLEIAKDITKEVKVVFKQDDVVWVWGATLSCFKLNFNVVILFFKSLYNLK